MSNYLDFDLAIGKIGDDYIAHVLSSPAGQADTRFSSPISREELLEVENFLLRGAPRGQNRRILTPANNAIRTFGKNLYTRVFRENVGECLTTSLDVAERSNVGLRIRLRLSGAPQLADLPWEYLFSPTRNSFFALSVKTPIVRFLDLPQRVKSLKVVGPIRILVMIANPIDLPPLDVEAEYRNLGIGLEALLLSGRVTLTRMPKATLECLQRTLRKEDFHIFHFIGHGGYNLLSDEGVLLFENAEGRGRELTGEMIGTILHDHDTLRLAVLNACDGGRSGIIDSFSGVAQNLIQKGMPAVVAMQFEISDKAAVIFAQEFYSVLAQYRPVETAMAEARKIIYGQDNNVEWGTPVIYSRSDDGTIFYANDEFTATHIKNQDDNESNEGIGISAKLAGSPAVSESVSKTSLLAHERAEADACELAQVAMKESKAAAESGKETRRRRFQKKLRSILLIAITLLPFLSLRPLISDTTQSAQSNSVDPTPVPSKQTPSVRLGNTMATQPPPATANPAQAGNVKNPSVLPDTMAGAAARDRFEAKLPNSALIDETAIFKLHRLQLNGISVSDGFTFDISDSGRFLAVANDNNYDQGSSVRIFSSDTGKIVKKLPASAFSKLPGPWVIANLRFSKNEEYLFYVLRSREGEVPDGEIENSEIEARKEIVGLSLKNFKPLFVSKVVVGDSYFLQPSADGERFWFTGGRGDNPSESNFVDVYSTSTGKLKKRILEKGHLLCARYNIAAFVDDDQSLNDGAEEKYKVFRADINELKSTVVEGKVLIRDQIFDSNSLSADLCKSANIADGHPTRDRISRSFIYKKGKIIKHEGSIGKDDKGDFVDISTFNGYYLFRYYDAKRDSYPHALIDGDGTKILWQTNEADRVILIENGISTISSDSKKGTTWTLLFYVSDGAQSEGN